MSPRAEIGAEERLPHGLPKKVLPRRARARARAGGRASAGLPSLQHEARRPARGPAALFTLTSALAYFNAEPRRGLAVPLAVLRNADAHPNGSALTQLSAATQTTEPGLRGSSKGAVWGNGRLPGSVK